MPGMNRKVQVKKKWFINIAEDILFIGRNARLEGLKTVSRY